MSPFELAVEIRKTVLRMVHEARASHVGSCLSCIDILAALYAEDGWLRHRPDDPDWAPRDRFILSKGHAAAALYATLAHRGYIPMEELSTYCANGARLGGHCTSGVPGVELSTGSLGHGLPVGIGLALGLRASGNRVVALMSDGELDEGSNWEAILSAPHFGLGNLIAIVDYNKIQSLGRVEEVLSLEPLADKFRAFAWETIEIDGHDVDAIRAALDGHSGTKPLAIVAHTVKGKGVSFMEDRLAWHYKSPNDAQLQAALAEVGS